MNNKDIILSIILVSIVLMMIVYLIGYGYGHYKGVTIGYIQACNDFYEGNIKMEPVEFKTIQWKPINLNKGK